VVEESEAEKKRDPARGAEINRAATHLDTPFNAASVGFPNRRGQSRMAAMREAGSHECGGNNGLVATVCLSAVGGWKNVPDWA
jgi:hypothetical protein